MSPFARRVAIALAALVALAGPSRAASPDNGAGASRGGIVDPPAALTLGGLARMVVSEVALNAPAGGFDESFSMGVVLSTGYEGRKNLADPATVGDLRAMLSALGVEAGTGRPEETLTAAQARRTLTGVRGALPRFEVPPVDERAGVSTGNPDRPGPCHVARQACIQDCLSKSPSGTGGTRPGCIQECQAAFRRCRRAQSGSAR
jgi:hypothetical protein